MEEENIGRGGGEISVRICGNCAYWYSAKLFDSSIKLSPKDIGWCLLPPEDTEMRFDESCARFKSRWWLVPSDEDAGEMIMKENTR